MANCGRLLTGFLLAISNAAVPSNLLFALQLPDADVGDRAANLEIFAQRIGPLFESRCWKCHSGAAAEGGLQLDSAQSIRAGGESGPLFDAVEPQNGLLIAMIGGSAPEMPQGGDPLTPDQVDAIREWIAGGAHVPEPWPVADSKRESELWSLAPVRRPPLPKVRDITWPSNEIDWFILARLEQEQLTPSPVSDRRTLIRRVFLDTWGLPPSPDEVREYVQANGTPPLGELVERVLASPHFGERAARFWLDVVRFAESNGFETNLPRAAAWPYRDYVIRAMNEDRPYDQFVQEQLAGDVLGVDEGTGFLVAGAWDQVKSPDPVLTANQRADELHDIVSTTGSAFLGLTVGCARCHDHKFDPIRQTDYYSVVACFAGVQHGERPLRREMSRSDREEIDELRSKLSLLDGDLRKFEPIARFESLAEVTSRNGDAAPRGTESPLRRRASVNPRRNVDRFEPISAKMLKFTVLKTNGLEPCLDELEVFLADDPSRNMALASNGTKATASSVLPNSEIHRIEHINDGQFGNGRSWISNEMGSGWVQVEFPETVAIDRVRWARDRNGQFTDRLPLEYVIEVSVDGTSWRAVSSSSDRHAFDANHISACEFCVDDYDGSEREDLSHLVDERLRIESRLSELSAVPMFYGGRFSDPPESTFRLFRGDPMEPRESIEPGAIAAVSIPFVLPQTPRESDRRLALARWIADPSNPLTPRVIVNRIWQNHFGQGLVATPSDFGANGARPSHPELLDWLAAELIEHQWSLKHIHRLILNSSTYRQASGFRADCAQVDANNRLLWRFPARRLEAEAIRDSVLAITGVLDLRSGGPGFSVFEPNDNYVRVYEPLKEFGPNEWRRMVYATAIRQRVDGDFGAFDCPDGGQISPRRNRSTTPLQALNLLNSRFMLQQSQIWGRRLIADGGADLGNQVDRAFDLAFQRSPSTEERDAGLKLAQEFGIEAVCRALFGASELIYLE